MDKKFKLIYVLLSLLVAIVLIQSYVIYDFKQELHNNSNKAVSTTVTNDPFSNNFFNNFNAVNTDPFEQMKKMQELMQKSFGQFNSIFVDDPFFNDALNHMGVSPLSDFKENDKEYIVEMSIPGAKQHQINVKSEDNHLTISANLEQIRDTNDTNYIHKERYTQRFERGFSLPLDAEQDKISTSYKNGILQVVIPKKK